MALFDPMKIFRLCLALLAPATLAAAEKAVALPTTAASPDAADLLAAPGARPKPTAVAAKPAAKPAEKTKDKSEWVFSILPKSFQKNPRLDLTVITEMTELGKQLPPVTPDHPAYFITQSSGYHQLGHAPGNEKSLTAEEVERILTRALATNGYLPAQPPSSPPSLVIFYTWGSHNMLIEGDDENPSLSGQAVARNLLDRAALVGGEKFARQLLELFNQADSLSIAASVPTPPGGEPVFGPDQLDFMNPVNQFKRASVKNEFLVDQAAEDVYYVVASAYDYRSITTKTKRLYWRTRMTVADQGVAQRQTLPTLIASAAPYFGQDMPESEILSKRPVQEGTVEIGPATVVPDATAPKPPAKKR